MSDLSDPIQAAAWIASYRAHYAKRHAGPVNLARRLRQTAIEQATNLRSARPGGYVGGKGREAYAESIRLLEEAATQAEIEAERWKKEDAERKSVEEQQAEIRRAELCAKYPYRG